MNGKLKTSLLTICRLLEKHNISYMLVGGAAVALNGYYRHSRNDAGALTEKPDIDIWYNPTYENYFNLLKVMDELGHDTKEFKDEQTPNPRKSFFKLDFNDFSLDLLPEVKASTRFSDANKRKKTIKIDDTKIYCMSYFDLIKEKEATARKKDLEDIEQLKKIKGEE